MSVVQEKNLEKYTLNNGSCSVGHRSGGFYFCLYTLLSASVVLLTIF